jgi:hypothetical protein
MRVLNLPDKDLDEFGLPLNIPPIFYFLRITLIVGIGGRAGCPSMLNKKNGSATFFYFFCMIIANNDSVRWQSDFKIRLHLKCHRAGMRQNRPAGHVEDQKTPTTPVVWHAK